jgi:hypothetical protein
VTDPITDKSVTARWTSHGWWTGDGPEPFEGRPSRRNRCGGPDMCATCTTEAADQPATTGGVAEAIEQDERDQADAVNPEVHRPSADYLAGYRAATKRAAEIARQSADRDTCTEPLPVNGDPEAMQTCDHPALPGTDRCPIHEPRHQEYLDGLHAEIRHLKQTAADRDTETAALREEYAGFFHPAWPDPLHFQYGDDPRANAARWYAEHVGQQPQIEIRRRVLSDWVTVDPASLRGGE